MRYVSSIDEVFNGMNLPATQRGAAQQQVMTALIEAAEAAIDNTCNRAQDGFVAALTATPRDFPGSGRAYQWTDECIAITSVAVKESLDSTTFMAWDAGDWTAFTGDPRYPRFNRTPYMGVLLTVQGLDAGRRFTSGTVSAHPSLSLPSDLRHAGDLGIAVPTVRITARWGYADTVPPEIRQATITQASRWYKRGEGTWADALANAEFGTVLFRQQLDPDLAMMLRRMRRLHP